MNGSQSRERELTAKKIGKILGNGFLEFIPYVTPCPSSLHLHSCQACTISKTGKTRPAIWHYQQNGKGRQYRFWLKSGWYCDFHIWDAIAQDGERTRYRRWQGKYFDAIQDFLNKENDAIIDSTD